MKKPKLVILDSMTSVTTGLSFDGIEEFAEVSAIYDRTPQSECVNRIGDAEAVFINRTILTREIMKECKQLKYIGILATGYNMVDLDYCREKGIVVSNVPGYSTNGVAQLAFTFILELMFLTAKHNAEVHDGKWVENDTFCYYDPRISEIGGKTIGLVGFGNIARQVAKIAAVFDMNILVYSRTRYSVYENDRLHFVSLDALLQNSDIVSLHVPLFPETTKLIDERAVSLMKEGALLINTARGGIIDENAVADALNSGHLGGAGLDVVTVEPILSNNPLLTAKNCIITPHIAWSTIQSRARLIEVVKDNLKGYVNGTPHNNLIC